MGNLINIMKINKKYETMLPHFKIVYFQARESIANSKLTDFL